MAAEEQPSRRRHKGTANKKKGDDVLNIICKLLLAYSLAIQELQGIFLTVFILPASSAIAKSMKEAAKSYSEEVKRLLGKGHGLRPPVIHVFAAMLQGLASSDKTSEGDKVLMQASLDDNKELPLSEVVMRRPHCKLARCYDQEKMRPVFRVGEGCSSLRKAISRAWAAQPETEEKVGRGPPTGLEQALEKAWEGGDGLSED